MSKSLRRDTICVGTDISDSETSAWIYFDNENVIDDPDEAKDIIKNIEIKIYRWKINPFVIQFAKKDQTHLVKNLKSMRLKAHIF